MKGKEKNGNEGKEKRGQEREKGMRREKVEKRDGRKRGVER